MTPEIDQGLARIRERHGAESVRRVEAMMRARRQDRHPLQKQAKWIMPGLTSRPWHDPYGYESLLPIVRGLEAAHPAIKSEFLQNRGPIEQLESYAHYKGTQASWKAVYLFRNGRVVADSEQRVPHTFRFMKEQIGDWLCPLLEMHFSVLAPGARILPHCDLWNFTINLHLAVDIPPACGLRVANEERGWEEGKCLLFDYSYLHEAWNNSDRHRTCLLMDLWNPEVSVAEREALVLFVTEIRKLIAETTAG